MSGGRRRRQRRRQQPRGARQSSRHHQQLIASQHADGGLRKRPSQLGRRRQGQGTAATQSRITITLQQTTGWRARETDRQPGAAGVLLLPTAGAVAFCVWKCELLKIATPCATVQRPLHPARMPAAARRRPVLTTRRTYWALHDCSQTLPAQREMCWGKPGVSTVAGHQRKLRLCISLQALAGNVRRPRALQRLPGLPSGSKHCLRDVGKTYKKRARHAHMGGMHPVAAHCVISSGATGAILLGDRGTCTQTSSKSR